MFAGRSLEKENDGLFLKAYLIEYFNFFNFFFGRKTYPTSNTPEGKFFSSRQGSNAAMGVRSILDGKSHPARPRSFVDTGKEII
jgi:hypothetical protein